MNFNFLKEHFSFNRSQKNGILFLFILIFILIVVNFTISFFFNDKIEFNAIEFKNKINLFIKENADVAKKNNYQTINFDNVEKSIEKRKITPFYFNPNNLADEKWNELGLTKKQIKTIKNFEAKGGKFRKKEDFKKMYCISDNEYSILEPYIVIPLDTLLKKADKYVQKKQEYAKPSNNCGNIDINTADTLLLQTLKGIGSSFSRKIVKYREKLGGFIRKDQLLEVWGMDNDRYIGIEKCISLGSYNVAKININTATVAVLNKHPYIEMSVAKALIAYRNSHGKFKNINEIKNCALIYEQLFNKLEPYLVVD